MLPQNIFWNLQTMKDHFWTTKMYFGGRTTDFEHLTFLSHCIVHDSTGFNLPVVRFLASHTLLQAKSLMRLIHLEEQEAVGMKPQKSSFALFTAILQASTCHLCAWGPCVGIH